MPTEHADVRTLNIGSTVFIMISNPFPFSPSMADSGTTTPSAVTGDESLPLRPSPSKVPSTCKPGASAGTSHSVLNPSARMGRDDHTYQAAWEAEVTQLLRAVSTTPSPLAT